MSAKTSANSHDAKSRTVGDVQIQVGGVWQTGGAGWIDVQNPSKAESVGRVASADRRQIVAAVASAQDAFPAWSQLPGQERGAVLTRAADLLERRASDVATLLCLEGGKLTAEAVGEIRRAADTLRWNGEEAGRVEGRIIQGMTPGSRRLSVPTPLGVVAAFAAWNFPAVLAARKLGAILASGCTTVLKAAEQTPATAAAIVEVLLEAGAPAGVVNLVFGDPEMVSSELIAAPAVRAVTFTGSTRVGRLIAAHASTGLKPAVLELGGHAPVIIDEDADLDLAVRATLPAKFGSAGQSCVAPSRYFVHHACFDEFVDGFVSTVRNLKPGGYDDPRASIGPVIGPERLAAMERLTADATDRGARVLCGGTRASDIGHFWMPTVLVNVPADADVMTEEPFGPIAVVNPFDSIDDAIAAANATAFAFAGYVFTNSLRTRETVIRDLHASNLGINQMAPSLPDAPLGGMQDSGIGYEGGRDGIAAFQHLRLVSETAALGSASG